MNFETNVLRQEKLLLRVTHLYRRFNMNHFIYKIIVFGESDVNLGILKVKYMNYEQCMQHRVLTLDPSGDLPKSSLYTLQPEPVSLERTQAAAVCHSNSYTHSSRDRLKNTGPLSMSPV